MDKNRLNRLTERQKRALPFFVASSSETEACRQAKIATQTYYEWLKDPIFRSELHRLRDIVIEDAVETLKAYTTKAVKTLVGLLDTTNPILQRNVANDILNHVSKFKELYEIEERLDALEAKN
jgi:hypothetical protein